MSHRLDALHGCWYPAARFPRSQELLARVLEPYSCKGCRYLIDAQYSATEDSVLAYKQLHDQ